MSDLFTVLPNARRLRRAASLVPLDSPTREEHVGAFTRRADRLLEPD